MSQLHLLRGVVDPLPMGAAPGRDVLDRYYTPPQLARAVVVALHAMEPISGVVLEPSAGGGAFARALLDLTPAEVVVSDLDPRAPALMSTAWDRRRAAGDRVPCASYCRRDFLTIDFLRPSWVIGNPPYSVAEEHIRHALTIAPRVAFLLRASFGSSQGRVPLWRDHPPRHMWQLAQRPSYTGGATDPADYAVYFWDRDHPGPATFTPGWSWRGPC